MYQKQHTLQASVSFEGIGLHSGQPAQLSILPAEEHHGFVFQRMDVEGEPLIPATLGNAVESLRATRLAANGTSVDQVEHVLSALAGMQIDNALLQLNGPEVPILDGSSSEFVQGIQRVGTQEQTANREFLVIEEPIHYYDEKLNIDMSAFPYDDFRVTVMVDYDSKVLGPQHATMVNIEDYPADIATNRTFAFLHELKPMFDAGLIKGGSLENALVIVDEPPTETTVRELAEVFDHQIGTEVDTGILNQGALRHNNEPARHKLLDLIGDMALLGHPLKSHLLTTRPGHAANIKFGKEIQKQMNKRKIIRKFQRKPNPGDHVFDVNAISNILPHRYPFLLVDRITNFSEDQIEGVKNVTANEPFFQGHFPGNPIMPGVLVLESMAQVGGILLLNNVDDPNDHWVYFVGIDNARFKKPVRPGDQLVFHIEMLSFRRNICRLSGKAYVGDQLVCSAELMASLLLRNS